MIKIQFCPKCKSILVPSQDSKRIVCGCGYILRQPKTIKIGEKTEKVKKVDIIDKTIETLSKTDIKCPECRHGKAYYWLAQTRSSDEAETQFFRCVKCSHQWRQY